MDQQFHQLEVVRPSHSLFARLVNSASLPIMYLPLVAFVICLKDYWPGYLISSLYITTHFYNWKPQTYEVGPLLNK